MEIAGSSFESSRETIKQQTGVVMSKGQLEEMASEMAADFDLFHCLGSKQRQAGLAAVFGSEGGIKSPEGLDRSKLLSITTGGKGVRVVESDLREAIRQAVPKRRERDDKSDPLPEVNDVKQYRRRMAQVRAVYTIAPFRRESEDIIRELRHLQSAKVAAQN
jgi:hypothetical protein